MCVCVSCAIVSVCTHVCVCVCVCVCMCEYVGKQCECTHVYMWGGESLRLHNIPFKRQIEVLVEHLSVHALAHWIFLLLGTLYHVQLIHLADDKVRA